MHHKSHVSPASYVSLHMWLVVWPRSFRRNTRNVKEAVSAVRDVG